MTVFAIKTSRAETVIHSFGSSEDGASPVGSLIDVNGALYGTTYGGSAQNYGTLFYDWRVGQRNDPLQF
jgi:hypothetical protein